MMLRSRIVVPLLAVMILGTALCSWGAIGISVSFGPPVLPVYTQPPCPAVGYIFLPGYWAWSPDLNDYYWVPGTWVPAPQPGFLWTPGWWGFSAGFYHWNPGYWGPTVGFYGGINYGFGYPGSGYYGGYWQGRDFYYNRAVNNVNITNVHVYNKTVVNNVTVNRVAYNGGPGGVQARPTQAQVAAEHQRHVAETSAQVQHEQAAAKDPAQFVAHNQGKPAVVATPKPGALSASNAVHASLPKVNRPAQTAHANNTKPAANNQPARTPNSAARASQNNVPHPPEHNQQARTPENTAHPNNTARRTAPAPRANEEHPATTAKSRTVPQPPAHNVPPERPNTTANNRPAPQEHTAPRPETAQHQAPAPQVHNAPRPQTAQHAAPAPRPEPQQQARVNRPPERAPQQHAAPAPRPPQEHQAEPPRQSAAHQPPESKGKEEERPH